MSSRRKGASSSSGQGSGEWQVMSGKGRRNPIPPPLEQGWQWQSRPASRLPAQVQPAEFEDEDDDGDDDDVEDNSDNDLQSDEFDSDSSQRSHNSLRKSKWFDKFVKTMEELSVEQVNEPERQWHCAACQGGPGAIEWYQGLQPLMAHAKTKGGPRMRHHRALARLLQLELEGKGTAAGGEASGRWKGLELEEKADQQIVWPPMVVVMNTQLEKEEGTEKWTGMGNQELLAYFGDYTPQRARHSYGPQGHRGMSVLAFEASARGYMEAERLHKHFLTQGTDREAWQSRSRRVLFYPGGKRQLYGFLATKQDLDVFNQHSQGKARLKFELKSYNEMVVKEIRQMSEDNQQLSWFKDKFVQEKRHSRAVEQSLHTVSAKLQLKEEESRIVRLRTKLQHQENQEEMYLQEEFFKDQIKIIHETRDAKDESFERLQQEERAKVESSGKNANKRSAKIESQNKEMEEYTAQRERLEKEHEEKKKAMKKRQWEEEVALEEELSANLTRLMNKYNPNASQ